MDWVRIVHLNLIRDWYHLDDLSDESHFRTSLVVLNPLLDIDRIFHLAEAELLELLKGLKKISRRKHFTDHWFAVGYHIWDLLAHGRCLSLWLLFHDLLYIFKKALTVLKLQQYSFCERLNPVAITIEAFRLEVVETVAVTLLELLIQSWTCHDEWDHICWLEILLRRRFHSILFDLRANEIKGILNLNSKAHLEAVDLTLF